jgi:CRISPR/Cas system-associated exonuclease Cas4 (RecB family)
MSYRVIQASEIVEYIYCRRAWWLRRIAQNQPRNMAQLANGQAYHRRHRGRVRRAGSARKLALILIFLAVSIVVFWFVTSS